MAIPRYDEMMLPLLRFLAGGAEHPQRELAEQIADQQLRKIACDHPASVRSPEWAALIKRSAKRC
jgi:hypothetical protein